MWQHFISSFRFLILSPVIQVSRNQHKAIFIILFVHLKGKHYKKNIFYILSVHCNKLWIILWWGDKHSLWYQLSTLTLLSFCFIEHSTNHNSFPFSSHIKKHRLRNKNFWYQKQFLGDFRCLPTHGCAFAMGKMIFFSLLYGLFYYKIHFELKSFWLTIVLTCIVRYILIYKYYFMCDFLFKSKVSSCICWKSLMHWTFNHWLNYCASSII